jgi:hypothetical protein
MLVGENYPNYIYIIFAKISKSVTNSNKICNKSKCLDEVNLYMLRTVVWDFLLSYFHLLQHFAR